MKVKEVFPIVKEVKSKQNLYIINLLKLEVNLNYNLKNKVT